MGNMIFGQVFGAFHRYSRLFENHLEFYYRCFYRTTAFKVELRHGVLCTGSSFKSLLKIGIHFSFFPPTARSDPFGSSVQKGAVLAITEATTRRKSRKRRRRLAGYSAIDSYYWLRRQRRDTAGSRSSNLFLRCALSRLATQP